MIKIRSGGTPDTTKVLTESGEEIRGISAVRWSINANGVGIAELTFVGPEVEIDSEVRRPLLMEYTINGEQYIKRADYDKIAGILRAQGLIS